MATTTRKNDGGFKPKVQSLKADQIIDYLVKATGLPEEAVRRILLLIEFSIYTSDGKRTKFAKNNGIYTYSDYLRWLEQHIKDFEDLDFITAISTKYNSLQKSLYSRVGAWIYKTYIVKSPEYQNLDDRDKVITANFFGISFVNRTYGQLLQMIVNNADIVQILFKTLDKSRNEVRKLVSGEGYNKADEEEDKEE